jgi:hypothetical protein
MEPLGEQIPCEFFLTSAAWAHIAAMAAEETGPVENHRPFDVARASVETMYFVSALLAKTEYVKFR